MNKAIILKSEKEILSECEEDNLAPVKPEADSKKKETSTEEIISKAENKENETPKADIKKKESEKDTQSLTEKK